jgi:hypothetical protein
MPILALVIMTVAVVALNATNVARKGILLAIALPPVPVVDMVVIAQDTVAVAVVMVGGAVLVKTATPVVGSDTWPEIAPKARDRNATTVGIFA